MIAVKRGAEEPIAFSSEGKRTCRSNGETTEPLISDSDECALSELSDEVTSSLSKSVVSIALCQGRTVLFAYSGIAIDGNTVLTSASLAIAFDEATKNRDNVEICHEGNVVIGILKDYDLKHEVAIVSVRFALDCAVCFHHDVKFLPDSKVEL